MRWTRWATLTLIVLGLVTALVSCAGEPQPMTAAEKLERGKVLASTSGCNDCHTPGTLFGAPDFERTLSGSELGWQGPWGTTYASNLTPHETGIAGWSEQDFVTALRTGHRPDGTPILPPMPWQGFSVMSDEDAFALAAYVLSLPPVDHKVPETLPPGAEATGSVVVLPPPSEWDAPRTPVPATEGAGH